MAKTLPNKQLTHQSHSRIHGVGGTLQKSVVKDDLYVHDCSKTRCSQTWAFWLISMLPRVYKVTPQQSGDTEKPKSYLPTTKSWWLRWVSPEASLHGRSRLGNSWATHERKYPRFALHSWEKILTGLPSLRVSLTLELGRIHQLTSPLPVSCMWYHPFLTKSNIVKR